MSDSTHGGKQDRYDEAEKLWDSVNDPIRDFYAKVNRISGGEGRVLKGIMAVLGQPCGVSRPPSEPLNDEEMEELRQLIVGFGWPVVN